MNANRASLLWACFLGSSWTWGIGMLFPILLLRDYGPWGWVAFAVPNVVGAAAMGFVLKDAAASERVIENHQAAALRFSDLTIAFHVFVVGWLVYGLLGVDGILATAFVTLFVTVAAGRRKSVLAAALLVTLASLALLGAWCVSGNPSWHMPQPPRLTPTDLLLFVPALVSGFVLCPYLDLTFHRARQSTGPAAGRWAFALGFGVVFLAMILFAWLYAPTLAGLFTTGGRSVTLTSTARLILGAQLCLQIGLTLGLHLREVAQRAGHVGLNRVLSVAVIGGALAYWAVSARDHTYAHLSIGEVIYRGFLLCYGLVVPAYVWLCMIPSRRPVPGGTRMMYFIAAAVVAAPMAYRGFILAESGWIVAAVGVLLLAKGLMVWSQKQVAS